MRKVRQFQVFICCCCFYNTVAAQAAVGITVRICCCFLAAAAAAGGGGGGGDNSVGLVMVLLLSTLTLLLRKLLLQLQYFVLLDVPVRDDGFSSHFCSSVPPQRPLPLLPFHQLPPCDPVPLPLWRRPAVAAGPPQTSLGSEGPGVRAGGRQQRAMVWITHFRTISKIAMFVFLNTSGSSLPTAPKILRSRTKVSGSETGRTKSW